MRLKLHFAMFCEIVLVKLRHAIGTEFHLGRQVLFLGWVSFRAFYLLRNESSDNRPWKLGFGRKDTSFQLGLSRLAVNEVSGIVKECQLWSLDFTREN